MLTGLKLKIEWHTGDVDGTDALETVEEITQMVQLEMDNRERLEVEVRGVDGRG